MNLIQWNHSRRSILYECFHCCSKGVVWNADFSFEDFGYEGDGIIHICHCMNCGAEIEYRVSLNDKNDDSEN